MKDNMMDCYVGGLYDHLIGILMMLDTTI